jgi:uncharacterized membrane-anchored protein YhcB (DUF1043 family)
MNNPVFLSAVEIVVGIIVEGVLLGLIFQWIASKETEKQEQHLKTEIENHQKQAKFDFEQLQQEIRNTRNDILSQIKESSSRS